MAKHASDPIFAAIERHKKDADALRRVVDDEDKLNADDAVSSAWTRANKRYSASLAILLRTPPTTAAGIRALLEYSDTIGMWVEIGAKSREFVRLLLRSPVLAAGETEGRAA